MTAKPDKPKACRIRCQLQRRHVTCVKLLGIAHVVYYGSEAAGLHFLHSPAVWGVAIFSCVAVVIGEH